MEETSLEAADGEATPLLFTEDETCRLFESSGDRSFVLSLLTADMVVKAWRGWIWAAEVWMAGWKANKAKKKLKTYG